MTAPDERSRPAYGDGTARHGDSLARRLLAQGSWALAGKLVAASSGLLISVLLTRLLRPTDVGAYFLALSVVTVAALAARGGLEQTVLRIVARSLGSGRPARARSAALRVFGIVAGTVGLTAIVLGLGGGRLLGRALFASDAMAGIGPLMGPWMAYLAFEALLAETFRGFHDLPRASFFGGATSRTLVVVVLLGLLARGSAVTLATVVLLTIGCGIGALLPALGALWRTLRRLGAASAPDLSSGSILTAGWPLLVSNLSLFVVGRADLWILGSSRPDTEVALYGVAARLVLVVGVPLAVVNAVLPPLIGELHVRGEIDRLERMIRSAASVAAIPSTVLLATFILAGGPILGLAFGSYYRLAAPSLGLLSVGQLAGVWTGSCGYLLIMTGHQRDMMWSSLVSGAVTVVGGLATVSRLGSVGVAGAVAAGMVTQQTLMLWRARRRCGIWTGVTPRLMGGPALRVLGLLRGG